MSINACNIRRRRMGLGGQRSDRHRSVAAADHHGDVHQGEAPASDDDDVPRSAVTSKGL